jgi:hypothetical protein
VPKNWEARDKKLEKRRHGMKVSNRSIFDMVESNKKRDQRKVEKAKGFKRENHTG